MYIVPIQQRRWMQQPKLFIHNFLKFMKNSKQKETNEP